MVSTDPGLQLNCPACGGRLVYGASSAPEIHHYRCVKCRECWKLAEAPTGIVRDPLRLAERGGIVQ